MVRTLRITSLVSVAVACASAVFVLVFGLKPNSEIKGYLSQDSIVEQLKKKVGTVAQKEDKVSPLVTQAKAFALRIDPPPPPPPPKITPPPPSVKPGPVQTANQVVPLPSIAAKFDLAGTAYYKDHPEKSLALLNLVSEGFKWIRQGEKVGQFTVHEVKDGSVVLYQNGKLDKELFVPKPESPLKSLLKSEQSALASIPRPSSTVATLPGEVETMGQPGPMAVSAPSGENLNLPGVNRAPGSYNPSSRQESTGNVRIRRSMGTSPVAPPAPVTPEPPVQPELVLSPEQQKQSLDESISGIKEMMNVPTEGMTEQERQEQTKAWKDLLDLLESEKKSLEQNSSKPSGDASDKKEAAKDNSGKNEKK